MYKTDTFYNRPFFKGLLEHQKAIYLATSILEQHYNPTPDFPLIYRDDKRVCNFGDSLPYHIGKLLPSNIEKLHLDYPELEITRDKVAYCDLDWLRTKYRCADTKLDIFEWYIRKIVKSNVKSHFFGKKSEMYSITKQFFKDVGDAYISHLSFIERFREVWVDKVGYKPLRLNFTPMIQLFSFCDITRSGYIDMESKGNFIGRIYFTHLDNNLLVQPILIEPESLKMYYDLSPYKILHLLTVKEGLDQNCVGVDFFNYYYIKDFLGFNFPEIAMLKLRFDYLKEDTVTLGLLDYDKSIEEIKPDCEGTCLDSMFPDSDVTAMHRHSDLDVCHYILNSGKKVVLTKDHVRLLTGRTFLPGNDVVKITSLCRS